jgi:hypothetical protein
MPFMDLGFVKKNGFGPGMGQRPYMAWAGPVLKNFQVILNSDIS